jgi:hypothetical protein
MQKAERRATAWLLPVSIVLAAAVLALGHGLNGSWAGMVVALVVGAFWLTGRWRGWEWVVSMALVLLIGVAALGQRGGAGGGWMLVGVVVALVAWDLDRLAWRMQAAGCVKDVDALERRHLWRLLIVAGAGLCLGAVALSVEIRLGFAVVFLLAFLAVLGLSRVVGFLQREEGGGISPWGQD